MAQQGQPDTSGAGTDPAYVPDRDVFDAYTHQQIWDLARVALAPAELRRIADTWGDTAKAVESAFDEFARDIARFSGSWSGLSATTAVRAATAFIHDGDDAVSVCRVVEQLLSADSTAAESVRAAIPPPPGPYRPDPDPAVEAAGGAQRRTAYNTAAAALTADAQDAMTFGYNPTIPASGDNVPRFPAPLDRAPLGDRPIAGAPVATDPSATPPPTGSDRIRTPAGRESDPAPSADPQTGPRPGTNESASGPSAAGPENTEPPADTPRPDTGAPGSDYPSEPADRSDADGPAPGRDVTAPAASDEPVVKRSAVESAAVTDQPRSQSTTSAGTTAVTDRPDPVTTRTAMPHRSPTPSGWGPAGTSGGSDTTGAPPAPAAAGGGNRPGPINSPAPAASQLPSSATGSDTGTGQRAGHSEQIARSAQPRAATEAARESLGTANTGPDTAANDKSEQPPGGRAARPTGLPLPIAARPLPSREPERERTGPDYLRAPNEQLTDTPPTAPPVFGEYSDEEKPDRTASGGGSR
ncbi:hypothetical protein [Nocardia sp. NBC_01329]|uniref:hypothetical protein n=1 Tax=Nocardia sp. NBC_01329 TaxID=2903594 RepID=UPI002E0E905B|nr:hypothetical protein OG405_24760 [Nocardia sp. NBC_01329]